MGPVLIIARREFASYFATPIAYVFLIIFAMLASALTFYIGNWFERAVADLVPLFTYLPWLLLLLVPAIAMRSWAEERRGGTIELLMTLPVTAWQAVIGKWMAGVGFMALALAATAPLWITVNILGAPDNGVIALSYAAAIVLAAVMMAMAMTMSALTANQVIAFVTAVAVIFVLLTAGTPIVLDAVRALPVGAIGDAISALSMLTHYDGATRGAVSLADIVYALVMGGFWLYANTLAVDVNKAGV